MFGGLGLGVEGRRRRRRRRHHWSATTVFSGGFWPWVDRKLQRVREALIEERDTKVSNELSLSLSSLLLYVDESKRMEAKWPPRSVPRVVDC